jgi:hypothetical protein
MRLFKYYQYKISHKENIELLFQRIENMLDAYYHPDIRNWFYFSDFTKFPFSPPPRSAIKKLFKKYDELSTFIYEEVREQFYPTHGNSLEVTQALSNMPEGYLSNFNPNNKHDNVKFSVLSDIAKNIPKTYPFNEAVFSYEHIDWFQTNEPLKRAKLIGKSFDLFPWRKTFISNSITFTNQWDINHRWFYLNAIVEIPTINKDSSQVQSHITNIRGILQELGEINQVETLVIPTDEEFERLQNCKESAINIIERYSSNDKGKITILEKRLNEKKLFIFNLSHSKNLTETKKIQKKSIIVKTFEPLGYDFNSNLSNPNRYILVKNTELNNQIRLDFYTGETNTSLGLTMKVVGPLWDYNVDLPYRYDSSIDLTRSLFPINDKDTLSKILANFSSVVGFMERTFVKELEELFGAAPEWYLH